MKKTTLQFPDKRILVAEDYLINQEVIKETLELMKIHVELAENGQEAVNKHQTNMYDLILMDIQMPLMDGFQATKMIREHEGKTKRTPIIALTANAISGDQQRCLDAGMDDYITKPIDFQKLEEIIKKHLSQEGPLDAVSKC